MNKKTIEISTKSELKQHHFEEELRRQLCQAGITEIAQLQDSYLVFDLSRSYWHDLGTLLWVVSLLYRLKTQGNDFHLVLPEPSDSKGLNLWSMLLRWGFFRLLEECVDSPVNILLPRQVPHLKLQGKYDFPKPVIDEWGRRVESHTIKILEMISLRPAIAGTESQSLLEGFLRAHHDKIVTSALTQLCGWELSQAKEFVERVIEEGVRNSEIHARGTFCNLGMRVDKKKLTFVVADNGVGIPEVLREAFKLAGRTGTFLNRTDVELIKYYTEPDLIIDSRWIYLAVQKGVSSSPGLPGCGLYYLKSKVLQNRGELRIRSGSACVDFAPSETSSRETDGMLLSPGTVIRVITPLT